MEDGTPMACGWLKDRYGLAWQIMPTEFLDTIGSEDMEHNARVMISRKYRSSFGDMLQWRAIERVAPRAGLEPATNRLTADRSTN